MVREHTRNVFADVTKFKTYVKADLIIYDNLYEESMHSRKYLMSKVCCLGYRNVGKQQCFRNWHQKQHCVSVLFPIIIIRGNQCLCAAVGPSRHHVNYFVKSKSIGILSKFLNLILKTSQYACIKVLNKRWTPLSFYH